MNSIDNHDDIIDSRDVIERIEQLNALEDDRDDDENAELATLVALANEAEGYGDWAHGETLVRDSHFVEYAQQLADDIGAIDRNASWPLNHIDWEAAAEALKQDYSSVDFDGVTYWIRS